MLIFVKLLYTKLAWSNQQRYVSYSVRDLEEASRLILSSSNSSLKDSEKEHDTYKEPCYQIHEQAGVDSSTFLILHLRGALHLFPVPI